MAMTTRTWHVAPAVLSDYVEGRLDALAGASVEQHLLGCAACRTAVVPLVEDPVFDEVWAEVMTRVERPPLAAPVRLARRLGLAEPSSVLLAASASMRTAWFSSSVVALGFAFLASRFTEGGALWPFLVVAPLVPTLGVAVSYGSSAESLEMLLTTTPYGRPRLILVRALAVLVTCLPLAFALSLLLPGPAWVAAAWLGPALAMIPVMMAIASFVGPRSAAAVLALLWTGLVVGAERRLPATWPVDAPRQLTFLLLAFVAGAVLLARSRTSRQIGGAL
jgi:hypothetical protein